MYIKRLKQTDKKLKCHSNSGILQKHARKYRRSVDKQMAFNKIFVVTIRH